MKFVALAVTRVAAVAFCFALIAPPADATQLTGFSQAVAEAASTDDAIAAYYRNAGYAPLWTGEGGPERRAAFLQALADADAHGLPSGSYDAAGLIADFRAARGEREIGGLEVETTRLFLSYARDIQSGALEPGEIMPAEIKRALPRRDPAETLAAFAAAENPMVFLKSLAPTSQLYLRLMREKSRLERIVSTQGWGAPVPASELEPEATGSAVVALRNRLMAMGYLPRTSGATYDSAMISAVRAFQSDHGIEPDGIAGSATIAEINIGPADRLKSVIVALERERWMNVEGGLGKRHVWVNLPDYHARVFDDGKITFETRAVVGERRPDKRTYEFSDEMEYMEVNPDWTVPRSILGRDYLPRMQSNPNAASYLQIIDRSGRVVPRSSVNFAAYTARNFPYTVRQAPGGRNALGRVKFMFPNPYAIYLHDTPQKNLFAREERDYSSGCIRLNDPFGLAYHLLARQMDNPQPFFDDLVNSGRQTRVKIDTHIPVHLVYFTAFSWADGKMQYRRDMYGRDGRLFEALREAGVAFPGGEG
jgi:murein L,D-transpeptidase YcbB/YkuD